jgi:hypothetical protein
VGDSPQKKFVVETLLQAVNRRTDDTVRLQTGLTLRQQIHDSLGRGVMPDHPRLHWLQGQSKTLVDVLVLMAKDYDKANSTDMASTLDLVDIAKMALGTLNRAVESGTLVASQLQVGEAPQTAEEARENAPEQSSEGEGG